MGMYDTIGDGYQIKCFEVPVWYGREGLGYMGGLLRYFSEGDPVPWRGWSYRFAKNMLIVDENPYEASCGGSSVVHVIRNGRYVKTYEPWEDIPAEEISHAECFVNYNGEILSGIQTKEDLSEYLARYREWFRRQMEGVERSHVHFAKLMVTFRSSRDLSDEEIRAAHEEYDRASGDEMKDAAEALKDLKDNYLPVEKSPLLGTLGAYLEYIEDEKSREDADEERIREVIEAFKIFLTANGMALDAETLKEYIAWNEMPEEEQEKLHETVRLVNEMCEEK